MPSTVIQTIQVDAGLVLNGIQQILPALEKYSSTIASVGGPIGLAVSAAEGALALLNLIPSGVVDAATQQALAARIASLATTAFNSAEWQPRK